MVTYGYVLIPFFPPIVSDDIGGGEKRMVSTTRSTLVFQTCGDMIW